MVEARVGSRPTWGGSRRVLPLVQKAATSQSRRLEGCWRGWGGRPEGKMLTLFDVMSGGGERGHRAQFGRLSVPSRAGGETRALRRASPRRPQGGPCADLLAGARNFAPGSRDEPNNKHIASAAPVRQPIPGQPTRNPFPPNRPPALARQSPPRLRSSTLARRHSQWDPARVPTSPRSSRMT